MRPPTRIPIRALARSVNATPKPALAPLATRRALHQSAAAPANVAPVLGTGPPPEPPVPEATAQLDMRVARRRKQAEMLKQAKELRAKPTSGGKKGPLKKRFWDHVYVKEIDGSYQVHLDTRPLRHPKTKEVVRIPLSKPNLALALAIEWDHLTSAQQATRQHLIPLTSLVCRAIDIAADDASHESSPTAGPAAPIRTSVATTLLRYLDTDSLLCWAPEATEHETRNAAGESLRDVQRRTADQVAAYVGERVWPGVRLRPVLDGESLVPQEQEAGVRELVHGWVLGLGAWELAGLERAVLAGKSLVVAARLVAEWSEGPVGVAAALAEEGDEGTRPAFGAEEAARATSLEVDWQTGRWGEVEDTHDVEKEDVRRQFGGVVLLVSGNGRP